MGKERGKVSERTFRGAVFLRLVIGFIMKLVIVTQKGGHTLKGIFRWPLGGLSSGSRSLYDLGQVSPCVRLSFPGYVEGRLGTISQVIPNLKSL